MIARRQLSLRVRLLAGLLGTTLVVLVGFDLVVTDAMRAYLVNRVNKTLTIAQRLVVNRVAHGHTDPAGESVVTPGTYYAAMVTIDGEVRPLLQGSAGAERTPRLPADLATPASTGRASVVPAVTGSSRFLLRVATVPGRPGVHVVVAASLVDVTETVDRMQLILALGIVGAFTLLASAGWVIARRGLLPLEKIAAQADSVSGGDFSARVKVERSATEVGRLAAALNAMLERIESSVAQRDLAQARMRTFMADASHELRTPLTTVRAYAELYEQGALSDKDSLDQALSRISSEATRMSDLVRQMLALARSAEYPAETAEPVDLTALASDLIRDARITNPQRTWTLRDPGRPVVVLGDATRLRQVLGNLLLNVRVHSSPTAAAQVRVAVAGALALIEVSDTGPGVPPEALGYLFDRFFRVDVAEPHRGSGLGLAIVAAIAEAHGGHVVATAAEPSGLTITVSLPLLSKG